MQPGNYGVVNTGNSFVARAIRWATHSWANHAFIVVGEGKVIEAQPEGVVLRDLAEYTGRRVEYNTGEPMTDAQRTTVVEHAYAALGDPYNFLDIGALGFQALGLHWRWAFSLAGIDRNALICSELVAACGTAAGLDWLCGKPGALYVTPGDLAARPGVR